MTEEHRGKDEHPTRDLIVAPHCCSGAVSSPRSGETDGLSQLRYRSLRLPLPVWEFPYPPRLHARRCAPNPPLFLRRTRTVKRCPHDTITPDARHCLIVMIIDDALLHPSVISPAVRHCRCATTSTTRLHPCTNIFDDCHRHGTSQCCRPF